MKAFYIFAALAVAVLAAVPFILLPRESVLDLPPGTIVGYDTYSAEIRSLDPATCGDTSSAGLQGSFYESLYTYHFLKRPPGTNVIPQLAAAMPEVSDDKLTYTIRLRPDIRYSRNACFGLEPLLDAQGQPLTDSKGGVRQRPRTRNVTADDFVLGFKRIADYHIESPLALAFIEDKIVGVKEFRDRAKSYAKGDFTRYDLPLAGVKALDDQTLQISLKLPFPQLIYVLAIHNYAPIPRELVEYHLATRDDGKGGREDIPVKDRSPQILRHSAVVGTGPYVLTEFVDRGKIVLTRNEEFREDYYPSEGEPEDAAAGLLADAGKRIPFVDVWYRTYVAESNPMWMLFRTKQSDTSGIPKEMFDKVINPQKELTDELEREGIRLMKYTSPAVYWFAFNMEDPVLGASKSLRQALCLSFDVEKEIDVLYNGRGIRALHYVPSSFEAFKEAGAAPYARYDLAAAREKIAAARRELIAAGVLAEGQPLPDLTLDFGDQGLATRRMAEFAQNEFARIGITLNVELNDWPRLQEKVEKKQVQMYSMGWHADYPDPENFLQLYYSPNIQRGTNNTNYANAEFDRLYEQAVVMFPGPERTDLYARMLRILGEDCPAILLSEPLAYVLVQPWVHNLKPHPIIYPGGRFTRIDVDARRKAGGR